MAVPLQPQVPFHRAVPALWLSRTAMVLFVAALALAAFPATPMGPSPFGFLAWSAAVVAGFGLSAVAAVASHERGHRIVRSPLGYTALALLAVTAALLAAAVASMTGRGNPEALLGGMTLSGVAAAVLGTLAVFRAEGTPVRVAPSTPSGWWAAAFLVAFLAVQFSPWAALTPATVMAGPALALAAIANYRDRSVLAALALVTGPVQLAFFALLGLFGPFTVPPGG
jgi:hypothetical protein